MLQKTLTTRHILFIALGSAIGTGLFYGSAGAIQLTGPSVIFAYAIAGLAAFMIMRVLGEMVIQNPMPGGFSRYANLYLGPLAGFIAGWSYILELILVCLADITAFSTYMLFWYPDVSPWIWALTIALFITALNLATVKIFGELEFWLSLIKILAISAMIIGGLILIFYGLKSNVTPEGFKNFSQNGGWFAHGFSGFLASFSLALFSFGGIEVISLTALETEKPEKTIRRAINAVPLRIAIFYIGTIAILITLFPWNEVGLKNSPFVSMFESLGFHSAATILNLVVISAAISAINSNIYGTSRMIYGLALEGQIFKKLGQLSKNGVPIGAVLIICLILILGSLLNVFYHEKLFFMISIFATFTQLIVWVLILMSHLAMRYKLPLKDKEKLIFPVPFWPAGPLLTLCFLLIIPFFFSGDEGGYTILILGFLWLLLLVIAFYGLEFFKKMKHKTAL